MGECPQSRQLFMETETRRTNKKSFRFYPTFQSCIKVTVPLIASWFLKLYEIAIKQEVQTITFSVLSSFLNSALVYPLSYQNNTF